MASVMDMLRMATGGMGGGAAMGPAPAVPADGAMGPTIGPGGAAGGPMSLAPPAAGLPQQMQGLKMGLPPSGILGLLRGQSPQGILGVLQQISRQPQQGGMPQQPGAALMTAFNPPMNPGEPRLPVGEGV